MRKYLPPSYEVRGKVMFILWNVYLSTQGDTPARFQSQMGDTSSFLTGGTPSFLVGGTPSFTMGDTPCPGQVPGQDRGYPGIPPLPSPHQDWMAVGQVMPWTLRLLRFFAGGLSCCKSIQILKTRYHGKHILIGDS